MAESNAWSGASHTIVQTAVIPQSSPKKRSSERLRELWPDIREMMRPRRRMLAIGFVLMVIGRVCGLVLPASTKYLIDNVIGKKQLNLLVPLVLAVLAATIIQGITSFAITQLVSKAAQRLIAELRQKVQAHIGRLPVAYLRREQDRNAGGAHHDRRGRHSQSAGHRLDRIRRRPADRGAGARLSAAHQRAADRHRAGDHRRIRAGLCARPSAPSGPFSASAARSTPKSPAG